MKNLRFLSLFLFACFFSSFGYSLVKASEQAPDKVLGVSKDATPQEITRAYHRLSLKWHPDKNPNNREEAAAKFREITEVKDQMLAKTSTPSLATATAPVGSTAMVRYEASRAQAMPQEEKQKAIPQEKVGLKSRAKALFEKLAGKGLEVLTEKGVDIGMEAAGLGLDEAKKAIAAARVPQPQQRPEEQYTQREPLREPTRAVPGKRSVVTKRQRKGPEVVYVSAEDIRNVNSGLSEVSELLSKREVGERDLDESLGIVNNIKSKLENRQEMGRRRSGDFSIPWVDVNDIIILLNTSAGILEKEEIDVEDLDEVIDTSRKIQEILSMVGQKRTRTISTRETEAGRPAKRARY
ncbi:J domain-containing protein [Candidatus Babeliales bacterium]|nr:J domain-containing protein [Candidatus Babeliales bacterium]